MLSHDLTGVSRVEQENGTTILYTADSDAVVRQLVEQRVPFSNLEVQSVSLEQAFITLTGGSK